MVKIKFINDWQYLFNHDAVGGVFASFTFIMISYMSVGMKEVDGFTFVLLGLGFRISK